MKSKDNLLYGLALALLGLSPVSTWSALGSGTDNSLYALAVSGSDVYAGGHFTRGGGTRANFIASWNGTNWSVLGSGMNDSVRALAVSDDNLYAGGFSPRREASRPEELRNGMGPPGAPWAPNTAIITDDGVKKSATVPATNDPQFFRLRRP